MWGRRMTGVSLQHCTQPECARRPPGRDSPRSILFADTLGLIPFWAKDAKAGYKMINARPRRLPRSLLSANPCSLAAVDSCRWILRMVEIQQGKIPFLLYLRTTQSLRSPESGPMEEPERELVETCSIITTQQMHFCPTFMTGCR